MKTALEHSVPSQLFDVYETIMQTVARASEDSKLLAEKIFSWLHYAKRPLQIAELREAVAIRDGDVDLDEEDLMLAEDMIETCGSLVIYDEASGIVRFAHEMVHDFLRTRHLSQLLPESEIAKACLNYLLFDCFEEGPSPDETSLENRLQIRPFGRYAARFWGIHVKEANIEQDLEIQETLAKLIKSSSKLNSMSQLAIVETSADWNPEKSFWQQNKRLLHVLAENDFINLAKIILQPATVNAETENKDNLNFLN